MLTHKGFIASLEVDEGEGLIMGRVVNLTRDVITFSGKTVAGALEDFHRAVEDYLRWGEEEGFEPEKPYRGEFMVRATPGLHREIATAASILGTSVNQFMNQAAQDYLRALVRKGSLPKEVLSDEEGQASA